MITIILIIKFINIVTIIITITFTIIIIKKVKTNNIVINSKRII